MRTSNAEGAMAEGQRQRSILVVEDDANLAQSVRRLLEGAGYQAHIENSGPSALTYASNHRPDLVILDLLLPGMLGYDVCRELRHLCHPWTMPVLMLTGMDRPIDQLRGFAFGADVYLTKPCEDDELLKTVGVLLGQLVP
jgi:DNA-binding response OmpR family regulator